MEFRRFQRRQLTKTTPHTRRLMPPTTATAVLVSFSAHFGQISMPRGDVLSSTAGGLRSVAV